MEIKHLSFDLWGTIFKSNPSYSAARAEIIQMIYMAENGTDDKETVMSTITSAYKEVGEQINTFQRKEGKSIPYKFKHHMVLNKLGIPLDYLTYSYYSMFDNLVKEHPPLLIEPACIDLINGFRPGAKDAISIVSNTQFVKGSVLLDVLKNYGLDTSRINCFFSDELDMCKPDGMLFFNVSMVSKVSTRNILHVGDDVAMDIIPADRAGMQTHICKNRFNWSTLKEKLEANAKDFSS